MEEPNFEDKYGDESSDFSEYSLKSEFSKPKLVEIAVQKCLDVRSQELKEGFFNNKTDTHGNTIKTWIPDSRKVYCSAVVALKFLMSPEIDKSHDMDADEKTKKKSFKEQMEEIEKDKQEIFDAYCYTQMQQKIVEGKVAFLPTKKKYMPEYGATVLLRNPDRGNIIVAVPSAWDSRVSAYWNEMVDISDRIFSLINKLLDYDLNYFKPGTNFGK